MRKEIRTARTTIDEVRNQKITPDDVKSIIRSIYVGDSNNAVFENYNEYCKNKAIDNGTFDDFESLQDTPENLEIILNNNDYLMAVADDVMQDRKQFEDVEIKVVKENKFIYANIFLKVDDITLLSKRTDDEQDVYYWDSIYHEEGYERKDCKPNRLNNGTIEVVRRYTKNNVRITMMIYYKEECKK